VGWIYHQLTNTDHFVFEFELRSASLLPVGAEFRSFATKIFGVAELQFAAHSTGE